MRTSRRRRKPTFAERLDAWRREALARSGGAAMIAIGVWLTFALATFSISDPSLSNATARAAQNWMGGLGAVVADFLLQAIGGARLLAAPPLIIWGAVAIARGAENLPEEKTPIDVAIRFIVGPLSFGLIAGALSMAPTPAGWPFIVGLGGLVGDGVKAGATGLAALTQIPGADAIAGALLVLLGASGYLFACGLTLARLEAAIAEVEWAAGGVRDFLLARFDAMSREDAAAETGDLDEDYEDYDANEDDDIDEDEEPPLVAAPRKRNIIRKNETKKPGKREAREAQPELPVFRPGSYELPALSLLGKPEARRTKVVSDDQLEQNARMLENVLSDFGVKGEIIAVRPGPVVTLYELEPAAGVKSSRVIGLADDIARSMSAVAARVAVVPGRNVIGIELPNLDRETVYIRELLGAAEYENSRGDLTLALGKSIGGEPVYADLARMPHLLIAGTTGSGKSVGINTMILSLLYRLSPDDCKMIMIDPKMLELSVYEGIPHLLAPVVTDPKKAVVALKWTVREMEERYRRMSKVGVRNIEGFNQRLVEAEENGEMLTRRVHTGYDEGTGEPIYETEELQYEPMPFIVVVIDEVADLMMVAGKDIEGMVQRLAQMARAAGIHLIMATQRPSVDVITGTIKANFPTRISFQVTSKIDSRTILGEQGAEQLLGMGDMLHMAGGGRIRRVHGAFVSDDEVEKVVEFLKKQGSPSYVQEVTELREEDEDGAFDGLDIGGNTSSGDALYDKAVAIVLRDRKASTSYIQRRLQIGYNRAATLIERMEEEGVVGAANHAGKREILVGENAA
ncbi:MAG: DNA translocase FtsK 4TM domain-containing protein [Parvularculaceae bacterium]|nr:DNA translocase FtsK 4TM domain-containing protein [Parvularculaceae bacterium]